MPELLIETLETFEFVAYFGGELIDFLVEFLNFSYDYLDSSSLFTKFDTFDGEIDGDDLVLSEDVVDAS